MRDFNAQTKDITDFANDIVQSKNLFVQDLNYDIKPDCQFPDIYDKERHSKDKEVNKYGHCLIACVKLQICTC